MMRIETSQVDDHVTFKVEGKLCGAWVAALEECWQAMRKQFPPEKQSVDLSDATFVDKAGWYLLRLMHREGVAVVAKGLVTQEIVDEITNNE